MCTAALSVSGVCRSFPNGRSRRDVLREVSLEVAPGEWVAVMGRSGSGKTTLLRCASGLLPVDSGTVSVGGVELSGLSRRAMARLRRDVIGFVFQDYNLVDSLTVGYNVALPLLLKGDKVDGALIHRTLADFGLEHLENEAVTSISGGERQRVSIARAFVSRPSVVFADEPTGALDVSTGTLVLDAFRRLADSGVAVLMVTHDLDDAAASDRVVTLRDGRILRDDVAPSRASIEQALTEAA